MRAAHRSVGKITEDPAVDGAERARVLDAHLELERDRPFFDRGHPHADQVRDGRRLPLARDDRAEYVDRPHAAVGVENGPDDLAVVHRLQRGLPALEWRCAADHPGEIELAGERPVGEARKVVGQMIAAM